MENEIKEELSTKKGRILEAIENEAMELTSLKCTIYNWKRIMDTCIKHGSELQCLTEVNKLVSKIDDLDTQRKDVISKLRIRTLTFQPIDFIKNCESNIKWFGSLCLSDALMHEPSVNMHTGNIEIVHVFDVANGTSGTSYGSGLFLGNFILLTNKLSSRVVKFNRECDYQSELNLLHGPYDITKINNSKVAVGATPQIIIIDLQNMQIEKTLTINDPFMGIQFVCPKFSEFIIAYSGTLMWIDASSGSRKQDFQTGGDCFYVHASGRNDYICAANTNGVCKYVDGKARFTYNGTVKKLNSQRGVDVDYEGNIYICGYSSKNVHQLTKDGNVVRIITASTLGISDPWIIRFEQNSNTFLLTDVSSGKVVLCKIG